MHRGTENRSPAIAIANACDSNAIFFLLYVATTVTTPSPELKELGASFTLGFAQTEELALIVEISLIIASYGNFG